MAVKIKQARDPLTQRRLKDYIAHRDLLLGNHWDILENPLRVLGEKRSAMGQRDLERRLKRSEIIYIAVNIAGLISKVAADFLFLEKLTLTALDPDGEPTGGAIQDALDDIWKRNRMQTNLYESALTNSAKGDSIWKINMVNGKAKIVEMRPELWLPEIGDSRDDFLAHNFFYPFQIDRSGNWYVHVERHTPGQIENIVYKVKNATTDSSKTRLVITSGFDLEDRALKVKDFKAYIGDMEDVVKTKLDFMPVVHIPNIRIADSTFGLSDYADLKDLMTELNARVSQVSRILDKHADPKMVGPRGILDDNAETERGELEFVEIDKEDVEPKYITWESALEHAFSQIERVVDFILMLSETSKAAFGMVQGSSKGQGQIASGEALKFLLIRTLAKVARKRQYYDPGINDLCRMALIMEGKTKAEVEIEWPDGLPQFVKEVIDRELSKYGQGAQSLKTTIENLNPEWDEERVDKEIEEIRNDGDVGGFIGNTGDEDIETDDEEDDTLDDIAEGIATP